jgi:putative tryptophan/tyrosine transport system substrate-binding protein
MQMRRREFLMLSGSAATVWSRPARAQPTNRKRRIGVLTGFSETDSAGALLLAVFRQQLEKLGWVEGRDIDTVIRWGDGAESRRLQTQAIELVRLAPDVIVVHGSRALGAVRRETDSIPILFASVADPVASGYVANLSRPGGNITGFTVYVGMPSPKLLELLKEIAPRTTRVAFLITPDNAGTTRQLQAVQNAAPLFSVSVTPMLVRDPELIEPSIASFAEQPHGGLVVTSDVFMITHREQIISAAASHRLPAVYQDRSFVVDGGLLSYSIDRRENYRQVAGYVDRILNGARPSELPIQQPIRFELVLNLKTARALGIDVPTPTLLRADEVIE